jgi:hypothetical protein
MRLVCQQGTAVFIEMQYLGYFILVKVHYGSENFLTIAFQVNLRTFEY